MTAPDDALAAIEARAAAAARIDRYALPAEVLASLADVPVLLATIRSLRAHVASEPERTAAAAAQWRAVDEDTAFAPPFSTIRVCRGCGCLVVGGPTVCNRCAESPTGGA